MAFVKSATRTMLIIGTCLWFNIYVDGFSTSSFKTCALPQTSPHSFSKLPGASWKLLSMCQSRHDKDAEKTGVSLGIRADLVDRDLKDGSRTNEGPQRYALRSLARSIGLSLVWYTVSSALAVAADVTVPATRFPHHARKRLPFRNLGTLLCLYLLSSKSVRRRNRFAGVIPKDRESRKKLAEDAKEQALSHGKLARALALLSVDAIVFAITFWYMITNHSFPHAEELTTTSPGPIGIRWWPEGAVSGVIAYVIVLLFGRFGQGYVRATFAGWFTPFTFNVLVKPAKVMASIMGIGADWHIGPDPNFKARTGMTSRQLRESLSTFGDYNPREDLVGQEGSQAYDREHSKDVTSEGWIPGDESDESPPDMRRS